MDFLGPVFEFLRELLVAGGLPAILLFFGMAFVWRERGAALESKEERQRTEFQVRTWNDMVDINRRLVSELSQSNEEIRRLNRDLAESRRRELTAGGRRERD